MITTLLTLTLALAPADDSPTTPPPAKAADRPSATHPVLPDGTYVYDWILDGKIVGQTTFSLITAEPAAAKTNGDGADSGPIARVASTWNFSARGSAMSASNETELTAYSLQARSYTSQQSVAIAQSHGARDKVDASIKSGIMSVRFERSGKIRKHDVIAPAEPYFLANQAFEHMVIIAAVAHAEAVKEKTYELLDPRGNATTLGTTLTREKKEGDRVRWKLDGFAMKGLYWLDARGILVRYQQGELEIALQNFTPRAPSKPKPKTPSKPK